MAQAAVVAGLRIPDREALSEIEASSRLFVENEAIYLSTPLLSFRSSQTAAGTGRPGGVEAARAGWSAWARVPEAEPL